MAKRAANGSGSIRKKTVTRNGKEYTYWEARVTVGRDPGTGRQVQRSFTGQTQKEVREKMTQTAAELDAGTYMPPCKMTVGEWLDIWAEDYLCNLKPTTVQSYERNIRNQIKPAMGAVKLSDLHPHTVQRFVNRLKRDLSPASVKLAYRILHAALEKAVDLEYIRQNPARRCELPRNTQTEIRPLEDRESAALLKAAKGRDVEHAVTVALFTGMRLNEILGLTWDAVDFEHGTINVSKQLTRHEYRTEHGLFISPKSGKSRVITPAPSVMAALRAQKRKQAEKQLRAGQLWSNPHKLVFTNEAGAPFEVWRLERGFGAACAAAGLEGVRFHDLRHTYAVNSIRAGDDIKTVQSNLGHATAAFTLDRYGHFTERMRQDSAARMEGFIQDVLSL